MQAPTNPCAAEEGPMKLDLLISGGHVVDPTQGLDGPADVGVADSRIVALAPALDHARADRVIDATGAVVTPGLVDLHTHVYRGVTYWGIDADAAASSSGVTTWIDAGSAGALTLPGFREFIVERARVRVLAFVNISAIGLVHENYEVANLEYLDVEILQRLVDLNRDLVVGIKVRLGSPTSGPYELEPLEIARRAADLCNLPLMVHVAIGPPSVEDVLEMMRPGDILTHCLTGLSMKIIDDDDRILECAREAWSRGVIMDVGHGAGSFSFSTAEAVLAAGFAPHVISSDVHQLSIRGPMFDLPTCMSKFLALGMPLTEVVTATTTAPAAAIGLEHAGTLRPGTQADVAIFDMHRGRFPLYDIHGEVRESEVLLRNRQTIVAGEPLGRREQPPPPPWVEPIWPAREAEFAAKQQRLHELRHYPDAMAAHGTRPVEPPSNQGEHS
jgi:dihydroorotase